MVKIPKIKKQPYNVWVSKKYIPNLNIVSSLFATPNYYIELI